MLMLPPKEPRAVGTAPATHLPWRSLCLLGLALSCLLLTSVYPPLALTNAPGSRPRFPPLTHTQAAAQLANVGRCRALSIPAGPPPNFANRTRSDRAIEAAAPLLIRNVTLWTGRPEQGDGFGEVRHHVDVRVADGIIQSIEESKGAADVDSGVTVIDGHLRWMTPGLIDVHVHAGLAAIGLNGIADTNSVKAATAPYLRSIDPLNNHDWSFVSIPFGGITTGLVLPGSADNVGGQAFPVKFGRLGKRASREGGWTRVVDPPRSLILPGEAKAGRDALYDEATGMKRADQSSSFRYMKMACGENPSRGYKMNRMDSSYEWRSLFTKASQLRDRQDVFCEKTLRGDASVAQTEFPDDFALEAVVDVLRGKVKVNTHCYTTEDLSSFVAHTNEFKFPLAGFHHAHEAYLVPELLKSVYGGSPAVALFSLNANYKTESYFGTPFASAILAKHNITTHIKSDHPVTDSRHLLTQVAQAHHYGLAAGRSLRGVTSSAAKTLGLDHRIGQAREGFDADLVLWDRHPLRVGASTVEVIIDGNRQRFEVDEAYSPTAAKGEEKVPDPAPPRANFSDEINRVLESGPEIIAWESSGFPIPKQTVPSVRLYNVTHVYALEWDWGNLSVVSRKVEAHQSVLLAAGAEFCIGNHTQCPGLLKATKEIDLRGGAVIPGLAAVGTELGLADVGAEPAARDGLSLALMTSDTARAVDGLRFGSNNLRFAHSSGVRTVVSAPTAQAGIKVGISTHFDAGARELFEEGSVRKDEVALHLTIDHWQGDDGSQPTIGQQVASIRTMLKMANENSTSGKDVDEVWQRVAEGKLPLIISVEQAETISRLVEIKRAYPRTKMILSGAEEAAFASIPLHLKEAGIPVLVSPIEWARDYDSRRAVRESVSKDRSLLGTLLQAGVQTGILTYEEGWRSFTLLWDTIAGGNRAGLSSEESLGLVTASLANILEIDLGGDMVAYDGSPFEYGAKPVAIATPRGVDLMEG